MLFTLDKAQRECRIGPYTIGGQPGDNPPLLIFSMFHNGDKLLESRKERKFDRTKAADYIKRQEELTQQTGIPGMVAMVATTADEMKTYIDFFTGVSDLPFGIDMWVQQPRLDAAKYVAECGLTDRLLYNSITPWDKDIPGQVEQLKDLGIKHIVLQVFDQDDQMPSGRLKSFKQMMNHIGEDTFSSILVDTSVMNLPAIAFSGLAAKLIEEFSGWPAGVAASNGTYMWKESRNLWGAEGFAAVNTAGQGASALLWSDFIFTGPMVAAPKVYPAVVSTVAMLAALVYAETGRLPRSEEHPLYKFFADFADKLRNGSQQTMPVHG